MANYINIEMDVVKLNISSNSKLLYGLIKLRAHKQGYCFASNGTFEREMSLSKPTLKRCLTELEKNGLITRSIIYKDDSLIVKERRIYVNLPRITDEPSLGSPVNIPRITDEPSLGSPVNQIIVQLNTINPNSIKDNNKELIDPRISLDAYAEEEEQKFISLFEKVEEACLSHGLKIGNRESALSSFYKIGDKVADGFMHRLKNDHTFKPTSLEDFLYDEEIDRMGQATL